MKPTMKNALRDIGEMVNAVIDNWDYWNDEQKKEYLWSIQSLACKALPKKMTIKEKVEAFVKEVA